MKTLQDLRDKLYDDINDLKDDLIDKLEELTPFQQGVIKGRIDALDCVVSDIRGVLKYHDCEFSDKACLMCGENKE